jgi:hypothetical protein
VEQAYQPADGLALEKLTVARPLVTTSIASVVTVETTPIKFVLAVVQSVTT